MVLSRAQGPVIGRLCEKFGELSVIEHGPMDVRVRVEGLRDRIVNPAGDIRIVTGEDEDDSPFECEYVDCTHLGSGVIPGTLDVRCQRHLRVS